MRLLYRLVLCHTNQTKSRYRCSEIHKRRKEKKSDNITAKLSLCLLFHGGYLVFDSLANTRLLPLLLFGLTELISPLCFIHLCVLPNGLLCLKCALGHTHLMHSLHLTQRLLFEHLLTLVGWARQIPISLQRLLSCRFHPVTAFSPVVNKHESTHKMCHPIILLIINL